MTTYTTIQQIKDANKSIGGHWFDPSTLRFFHSIIRGPVIANMFISSERYDTIGERRYTIRECIDGRIDTVGEFQQYTSKADALKAIGYEIERRAAATQPKTS